MKKLVATLLIFVLFVGLSVSVLADEASNDERDHSGVNPDVMEQLNPENFVLSPEGKSGIDFALEAGLDLSNAKLGGYETGEAFPGDIFIFDDGTVIAENEPSENPIILPKAYWGGVYLNNGASFWLNPYQGGYWVNGNRTMEIWVAGIDPAGKTTYGYYGNGMPYWVGNGWTDEYKRNMTIYAYGQFSGAVRNDSGVRIYIYGCQYILL